VILLFKLFFLSLFLNNLNLLYLSNGESSTVGTIYLKISITIVLEVLLSLRPLRMLASNPFTLIKGFDKSKGNVNLTVGEETPGAALGLI